MGATNSSSKAEHETRMAALKAATAANRELARAYRAARLELVAMVVAAPARAENQFPKRCTACTNVYITEQGWNELPAARGGLYAMGLEWRNHECGGTLCVELADLLDE